MGIALVNTLMTKAVLQKVIKEEKENENDEQEDRKQPFLIGDLLELYYLTASNLLTCGPWILYIWFVVIVENSSYFGKPPET